MLSSMMSAATMAINPCSACPRPADEPCPKKCMIAHKKHNAQQNNKKIENNLLMTYKACFIGKIDKL
jgi:hypothetical protein